MKKLLGTVVFAAALMYGAVAQAAAINIVATQQGPGSNQWVLSLDSTLPVAAIAIVAPNTATFVINAANTAIASIGGGSSYGEGATPGLFSLNLNPATCVGINCTPFGNGILGVFTAAGPGFQIGPDDESVGGTAFDGVLAPYDLSQIEVQTVAAPEPAVALMLGVGLAALGLIRRRA
jgi:hypothetical protein